MDKILSILYKLYKKIRPPKRLYRCGTVGLHYFDDRTNKEKIFDKIDTFFFDWQQSLRYKRAYRKAIFNSFFCTSTGTVISSMDEIKAKEKKGYAFCTMREMEYEADKAKKHIEATSRTKRHKYLEDGYQKIMRGTSNFQEQVNARIKSGEYEIKR